MKTTEEMFDRFHKECEYWMKKWGLTGWEVLVEMGKTRDSTWIADCKTDVMARSAVIRLNEEWDEGWGNADIESTAYHEVAELRFAKIHSLAHSRYVSSPEELEEAIHELIQQETNIIWKKDWNERNADKE